MRRSAPSFSHSIFQFQSTHPLRDATKREEKDVVYLEISIHAPLAGCDEEGKIHLTMDGISIHAPLAGCDVLALLIGLVASISIHAPLAGCDLRLWEIFYPKIQISIHAPLAGCDGLFIDRIHPQIFISIHAPLAGCDQGSTVVKTVTLNFNPRTPCGMRQQNFTRIHLTFMKFCPKAYLIFIINLICKFIITYFYSFLFLFRVRTSRYSHVHF